MITRYHNPVFSVGFVLAFVFILSCGEHELEEIEAAHVHDWGEWVVTIPATCKAQGTKTRTCTIDPLHTETEDIAQLDWGEWVVTADACRSAGRERRTCPNNASPAETRSIAKLEYDKATEYCSYGIIKPYGTVTDGGGNTYKTVEIGGQVWMAENLNYDVPDNDSDVCYAEGVDGVSADSIAKNCATYGRLYNWATAMNIDASCNYRLAADCGATVSPNHTGICPAGWHLPSNAEWNTLMKVANPACKDNNDCAASTKLKATSGWAYDGWNGKSGSGTDVFGFSALPGGYGYSYSDSPFRGVGSHGVWWSASANNSTGAYLRIMYYNDEDVYWHNYDKYYLFSVRCVKD
jgi:uncharacterized protein (TIGR02145 family)